MSQLHHACHVGCAPFNRVGERCLAIVVFVALEVSLCLQPDAVLVAEVVEVWVVAVVRRAHMVDVGAFHHHHLLLHLPAGDGMAALWIGLVAVHAFQLQWLAVHQEVAAGHVKLVVLGLHVLDLHGAEAYLCGDGL